MRSSRDNCAALRRAYKGAHRVMSVDFGSRWFVAQTHPHCEVKAAVHLGRQGFATYLPRYLKRRRHARRVEQTAAPLFPRYLFVSIDLATQRWLSIDSTIGVTRLVCNGEIPTPVPHPVIDAIRRREDANGFVQLLHRPQFAPGDKIRVIEGALDGCCGLYEGMSSRQRVTILLDLLGRKVRALVDTDFIEAA
jgi:transcriptional antiterminator RfaH